MVNKAEEGAVKLCGSSRASGAFCERMTCRAVPQLIKLAYQYMQYLRRTQMHCRTSRVYVSLKVFFWRHGMYRYTKVRRINRKEEPSNGVKPKFLTRSRDQQLGTK